MSSKITMPRGRNQVLYKYLPDEWIDFYAKDEDNGRNQYTAKVDHWSSDILDGINSKRVIRLVNQAIQSYRAQDTANSKISPVDEDFMDELTIDNCDIRTPKESSDGNEKSGIFAKIDPLYFYCNECGKIYKFKNVGKYSENGGICEKCGNPLSQFRQIYYCECGYATSEQPTHCNCGEDEKPDLYWYGDYKGDYKDYKFICKRCGKVINMEQRCGTKGCGKTLHPKNVLASAQFFAYSLHLIDLIDAKLENFISENDDGAYMTFAYWIGKISKKEFENVIENGIIANQKEYYKEYEKNYKKYENFEELEIDEATAMHMAKDLTDKKFNDESKSIIGIIRKEILSEESVQAHAESILEYDRVRGIKNCVTLNQAGETAALLQTIPDSDLFSRIAQKYGFSDVRACDEIPFITCSYGYTREKSEYEPGVQLRAFKHEKENKKNIYAIKDNTEGVLFEFDRRKILEWLLKNDYVSKEEKEDMPNLDSEEKLKIWFINHINIGEITTFNSLSEIKSPATYYVYRLIHSISHLLIRAAADIGGLGKDSLSEYIFPDIPAVLIFVQNSQGFNLGSLWNTFEAYFDEWIERAEKLAQKCIYDPICIERDKACTGCLFLNEISCQHYNKDLDRSLVIGYTDRNTNEHHFGFWEED